MELADERDAVWDKIDGKLTIEEPNGAEGGAKDKEDSANHTQRLCIVLAQRTT